MRSIKELKKLKGKRVLLRVDFNVPIKDGHVEDAFRIEKALPSILYLVKAGAKVILISHLGKGEQSLLPVAEVLSKSIKVRFLPKIIGEDVTKAVEEMKNGDVLLLENLRMDKGEQAKDKIFALTLSKMGDFYVNDAFPVSHREDASIVLLPKILPAYAGLQLEAEVKNLSLVFEKPPKPFLFILGGAKLTTKIPLIEKYLKFADKIFIGGAVANDVFESKGISVGKSLVDDSVSVPQKIIENEKIILPVDLLVNRKGEFLNKGVNEIGHSDIIIDIGKETIDKLSEEIKKSKLILWNGPLGKYEDGGDKGTKAILQAIAKSKAKSIIGGGDTVELIDELGIEEKFTFVSTGGGATLDFLANGTLPGIKALN